jgi:Sulfotransferase family
MSEASEAAAAGAHARPPMPGAERPRVIYVMGAGHSGSTILGVALGNCEGVFFAGELVEWTARAGVPKFGGLERTRFWRAVAAQMSHASDLFGDESLTALERSSSVLRLDRWRSRRRMRRRFREVSGDLYRAISAAAGATHIVDSSHFPLRAKELQRVQGIELHVIFLIRDARSVMESYVGLISKHDPLRRIGRILSKNADLWLTYLLSVMVFLKQPRERRLLLRHEDFIADPHGALRRILDQSACRAAIPDLSALSTGMPLQGNPLLWSDVVALNSRPVRAPRGSRMTALLQLPWTLLLPRLKPAVRASIAEPAGPDAG